MGGVSSDITPCWTAEVDSKVVAGCGGLLLTKLKHALFVHDELQLVLWS